MARDVVVAGAFTILYDKTSLAVGLGRCLQVSLCSLVHNEAHLFCVVPLVCDGRYGFKYLLVSTAAECNGASGRHAAERTLNPGEGGLTVDFRRKELPHGDRELLLDESE